MFPLPLHLCDDRGRAHIADGGIGGESDDTNGGRNGNGNGSSRVRGSSSNIGGKNGSSSGASENGDDELDNSVFSSQSRRRAAAARADHAHVCDELLEDSAQWPKSIMTPAVAARIMAASATVVASEQSEANASTEYEKSVHASAHQQALLDECAQDYMFAFQLHRLGQSVPFSPRLVPSFVPIPPPPPLRLLSNAQLSSRRQRLETGSVCFHAGFPALRRSLTDARLITNPLEFDAASSCMVSNASSSAAVSFPPLLPLLVLPAAPSDAAEIAIWVARVSRALQSARVRFAQWRAQIASVMEIHRANMMADSVSNAATASETSSDASALSSGERWHRTVRLIDMMSHHTLLEWCRHALRSWIALFAAAGSSPRYAVLRLQIMFQIQDVLAQRCFP